MRLNSHHARLCLIALPVLACASARATPFIPIEWQQRVKAGALEDQRKHIQWIRDFNENYVDDAIDLMDPEEKTTVIVQLSECLGPDEAAARFAAFGTVRSVGTLVAYVILDGVAAGDAAALAMDPAVAAVERDEIVFAHLDIGTRAVRARSSVSYSPETFGDLHPAVTGAGVNVAIFDTGVDDAMHAAFAGKFVAGYNALTATPGNPNDDNASVPFITTGPNGICATTAAGDDTQFVPPGQGFPDPNASGFPVYAILPGPNGIIDSIPGGDDSIAVNPCDGVTPYLRPGPDGICNTIAAGDDFQYIPVGQGGPNLPCVLAGGNGVFDSPVAGDDTIFPGVWHGTHVAGTALGLGVGAGCRFPDDGSLPANCAGMAVGAGLVDVKVLDAGGSGSLSGIIDALEWVYLNGN